MGGWEFLIPVLLRRRGSWPPTVELCAEVLPNSSPSSKIATARVCAGNLSDEDAAAISTAYIELRQYVVDGAVSNTLDIDHHRIGGLEGGQKGWHERPANNHYRTR